LLDENEILNIASNSHASLTNALIQASQYLEELLEEKKSKLTIMDI